MSKKKYESTGKRFVPYGLITNNNPTATERESFIKWSVMHGYGLFGEIPGDILIDYASPLCFDNDKLIQD